MSTLLHHIRNHSWAWHAARPLSNAGRPSRMLQMKGGIIDLLREASWPCPSFRGNKFSCLENTKCRKIFCIFPLHIPMFVFTLPSNPLSLFLSFFPNHYPHRLEEPSWPANKQTGVWGHSHMTSTLVEGKYQVMVIHVYTNWVYSSLHSHDVIKTATNSKCALPLGGFGRRVLFSKFRKRSICMPSTKGPICCRG